jgi:hypothetical protein
VFLLARPLFVVFFSLFRQVVYLSLHPEEPPHTPRYRRA